MSKKQPNIRIGGFAAQNGGDITDCYSSVRINVKKGLIGGFVGENSKLIAKSFACAGLNKLTGGFAGADTGNTEDSCYFFHNEKEGSRKLSHLWDNAKGQRAKKVEKDEDFKKLGFDIETVWQRGGEKTPLQFIPNNWRFKAEEKPQSDASAGDDAAVSKKTEAVKSIITITTADQLFELAKKINDGDHDLADAHIQLACDIDLAGREWVPIGYERTRAFTGVFDGNEYTVRNFVIRNKGTENKGFFGFLKGVVCNLIVDCRIKGGLYTGGIAAQNEGGSILYCGAVVDINGNKGNLGGLVGRNAGTVIKSYAAGKIGAFIIPWWWFLPLLLLLLLLLPVIDPFGPDLPVFAPVPYDMDAVPYDDGLTPNTDRNFVSFQFEQYIDVSLNTGLCRFNFRNPGNSNHNIVVQLHFTDGQATRVMGSTGRSEEEQSAIEATGNYNPENYRTVIAESGAIRPGYALADLRLTVHANGAVIPPGNYNAMVYLIFYDINTHSRAMLESQLPVVINVRD